MIEAASTSRHASQSLHATRSHIIAMAADKVRSAIAVRLRVNNQHGFADLRLEGILARKGANLAFENNMRGNEFA